MNKCIYISSLSLSFFLLYDSLFLSLSFSIFSARRYSLVHEMAVAEEKEAGTRLDTPVESANINPVTRKCNIRCTSRARRQDVRI